MIATRGTTYLHAGDLFFVLDGGMHGNKTKLMNCFVDEAGAVLTKTEKTVFLSVDEARASPAHPCVVGPLSCVRGFQRASMLSS